MVYDYESFKSDVYKLTNINLNLYKEKQMKRRIESLLRRHGYRDFESFMQGLRKDAELLDAFINHLTINVSEFYRNPGQWEFFETEILPYLVKKYGDRLTIWSAACSTGDEPYTIAMIMAKYLPLAHIKIYATDIDEAVLKKAQLGIYSERSLEDLPRDFFNQHFQKVRNGGFYQISDEIKHCVEFKKHNLLEDRYPSDCHLIVCRNVVIYFTEEAKKMVYKGFHKTLVRNGILFIGSTEQIIDAKELGFAPYKSFFYQAVPIGSDAVAELAGQRSGALTSINVPGQRSGALTSHSTPGQRSGAMASHSTPGQGSGALTSINVPGQRSGAMASHSTPGQRSGAMASHSTPGRGSAALASHSTPGRGSGAMASHSTPGQRSRALETHHAAVQEHKNKASHAEEPKSKK